MNRKGPSGAEQRVDSYYAKRMVSGPQIGEWLVDKDRIILVSLADLRHYFHAWTATRERAETNVVGRALPFNGFDNFPKEQQDLLDHEKGVRRALREVAGDRYGLAKDRVKAVDLVHGAFQGLPMGDHVAVEVAEEAHWNVLEDAGLLETSVAMRGDRAVPRYSVVEALELDDHFILESVQRETLDGVDAGSLPSEGRRRLEAAARAYDRVGLEEAADKRILDSVGGTVIGADIDGRKCNVRASVARALPLAPRCAARRPAPEVPGGPRRRVELSAAVPETAPRRPG